MTMDYKKTAMGGSIVFVNPNATATCGCGKSFNVGDGGCTFKNICNKC
jgi:Fe-S cluster assembly iron-binding protein IscA